MSGAPEEPPDDTEVAGPSESAPDPPSAVAEICEDNKSQLETFKDIMLKNKKDLKKKEEELREYASKLSQIKSRAKRSRRGKDSGSSSAETTPKSTFDDSLPEADEDTIDDISQAKTPKAKSSLLQRKLAENRVIFEQRSKEMTESKRAVEEKVEALRQQMDQTDLGIVERERDPLVVTPVRPVMIAAQIVSRPDPQVGLFQDKDNKIAELSNRVLELEATVIDLQDNLREKDSVIDSKTKAVTLMSADLSKKGKSTLDTLEDTKDEMRTMQENFVLIETSLKGKNENLLEQLRQRNDRVTDLEATINRYEEEMEEKRLAETASSSLSRTTMETLADTKDAMRSMQENFVLIETSLREKVDNLLKQLEEREIKLAEAEDKIYKFESGAGVLPAPEIPDLRYKIERLERSNLALQDEKYELQKSIVELQEKIIARESSNGNGLIVEKDNRIAELENLIEELKNSNQLLEEESKAELQKQVDELATRNDEFRCKIDDLERLNNDLETEMSELRAKLPEDSGATREDAIVKKLTKELDDLNKSMIKLKAQHKGKLRNLQKQLESFKMVSDANAELVKLGNQVALLEEEKGNLQLSLVDFDELKASAGDWQDRIADLESRVSTQANDIQAHVEAIAILENQKLDLMQDLHTVKQEISALEAENAESENLRVTAEMKIVDMEEQFESLHKLQNERVAAEPLLEKSSDLLINKIESLTRENSELVQRIAKLEEKPSSEAGSTESFETINEDKNELTKRMEALSARNAELEEKLSKLEESSRANVSSTESFETINDSDRSELVKKIDLLSRENSDLVTRLNKYEEKGSSDTGSTESFEKIPEHVDGPSRIEILTRENSELVIKLTKLEEKMDNLIARPAEESLELATKAEEVSMSDEKLLNLTRENSDLAIELTKVQEKLSRVSEEKDNLQRLVDDAEAQKSITEHLKSQIESLTLENHELVIKLVKLEEKSVELRENLERLGKTEADCRKNREDDGLARTESMMTVASLETEIETGRKLIAEQNVLLEEMRTKLADKETELETRIREIGECEATGISVQEIQRELTESFGIIEEWRYKCTVMEQKMEVLESAKSAIEEDLRVLQDENRLLIEETRQRDLAASLLKRELDDTIGNFANRLDEERAIAVEQEKEITGLRELLLVKEQELHDKYALLQNELINIDSLQEELNDRRAQLEGNETIIVSLREEIQSLKAETILSKEQVSTASLEIAGLREELSTKAAKEARNEELVNEMKTIINDKLGENANLRSLIDNSSAEVENLRTFVDNSNAEIESLRALLIERSNEVASLVEARSILEEKIQDSTIVRETLEIKLASLQNNLDDRAKYAEELKAELTDAYRMMELLKVKHTEDVEMQNRRLEDLIEDLNARTAEREVLLAELADKTKLVEDLEAKRSDLVVCREQLTEKEMLVGRNVTERAKIDLELRVRELEEKLGESEANTQTQLQKRKILAANLKKKTSQYEELEAKAAEFEAKATEFEAKVGELGPKAAELEAKVAELEPKAAELGANAQLFEAKATELEALVSVLEAKVAEIEPKAAEFEAKATELGAKVTELEAELVELKLKAAEFEAKVTELETKVTELETTVAVLEPRAAESEAKATELGIKSSELEAKVTELEAYVAELEPRAAEFEAKATGLGLKSSELEAKITELEAYVAELEPRAAEFEAKATDLGIKAAEFEAEAKELGTKAAEFEAKATDFETKVAELESKASTYEARTVELEVRAEEFETKAAEFESCAAEFQAKASKFEAKVQELEPKTATLEIKVAELEAKATELEEKWISEKSEKDASNLRIQENESTIRDKNEAILNLEEQLTRAQSEAALSVERSETLSSELNSSTEKITTLMSQVTDMLEEMEKLREEVELRTSELLNERLSKESLIADYETRRQSKTDEETRNQQILEEARERARELGVRMQVMESEYVEQLNTIQTLRTENGMLVSKQAQINERLENVEKESSERKILLDQFQRETVERETEILRRSEASPGDDEQSRTIDDKQQSACGHCDQCQTVVQALEAKLQERDAEIENLDNELANSIGNFVHMRESLRVSDLMNQSGSRSRNHDESRDSNDLVSQYNALTASNAELRDKLNSTIRENQELREKIVSLQALNVALRERTGAAEDELIEARVDPVAASLRTVETLRDHQVPENCQARDEELRNARIELETMRQRHEELCDDTRLRIQQLEAHNSELTSECENLSRSRDEAERRIVLLGEESASCQRKILELETEIDKYKDYSSLHSSLQVESKIEESRAPSSLFAEEKDDAPKLFDAAKLFGPAVTSDSNGQRELTDLRNVLASRDLENAGLSREINRLGEQIFALESQQHEMSDRARRELEITRDNCQRLEIELAHCQQLLDERNLQIKSLNSELNNAGVQIEQQLNQWENYEASERSLERLRVENDECVDRLRNTEGKIESLSVGNFELAGTLENLQRDNLELIQTIDLVGSILNGILGEFGDDRMQALSNLAARSPTIHSRLVEITSYLDSLRNERNELIARLDDCGQRISTLEEELRICSNPTRIQELEEHVSSITRERDVKQLQVNDLARSLEEMQVSMENAATNEEIRLRNLQASLDRALSENDQLKIQLDGLSRQSETVQLANIGKLEVCETLEKVQSEKLRVCETRETQVPAHSSAIEESPSVSGWDDQTKLDEEMWTWNPEDAQLAEGQSLLASDTLLPSLERRLNARVAELEDTIRDLETERAKLKEEIKVAQTRSGKLVKKLKEFKIQNESLQQQLKIQKATVDFCDLDATIEEELKSQIGKLERALNEAKEEIKKIGSERDNLSKRIDVLGSANERLVEMKERQDMEVEVLQIRTKELSNKLQTIDWQFRETCGDEQTSEEHRAVHDKTGVKQSVESPPSSTPVSFECLCKKYKEEIEDLRDEMEALAAENEQLQKLLEEHRNTRLSTESRLNDQLSERGREIDDLSRRNNEIQRELEETRDNSQSLMEQSNRDVENLREQIADATRSQEILKIEIAERATSYEAEVADMREQMNSASLEINELRENLRALTVEKGELIERTKSHDETIERLAILGESMTELTDLLNARVQEVAELKRVVQKLKADRNEALDTVEGLAQNHTRELSLRDEESRLYVLECESRLNVQSNEIADLREKLSSAEHERSSGLVELENTRGEIERLGKALVESRNEAHDKVEDLAQNHTRELSFKNEESRLYVLECESRLNDQGLEIAELREKLSNVDHERSVCLASVENMREEIERLNQALGESKSHRESLQSELASKEQELFRDEDEVRKYALEIDRLNEMVVHLQKTMAETVDSAGRRIREIEDREASLKRTVSELTARENEAVAQLYREINEKDGQVADLQRTVVNLEEKIHDIATSCTKEKTTETREVGSDDSLCGKTTKDEIVGLQKIVDELRKELSHRNEDIEDYKYQLSESTYPAIIQALQDQVNIMYEERASIEQALDMALEDLSKERELRDEPDETPRYQSRQLKSIVDETDETRRDESQIAVTRDTGEKIRALRLVIDEREARLRNLMDRQRRNVETETNELRLHLATKEEEIAVLQRGLSSTSQECELLRNALRRDLPKKDTQTIETSETSSSMRQTPATEQSSNELDIALYMLHQRDLRCEELTLELMQLLEERDTLQLRLSNAIRVNEELRGSLPNEAQSSEITHRPSDPEPLVEEPSPSRSVGPVEIAKEAIDNPNEEKIALAQKLSQLHNMGHRRDVRLMDDRDMRHNQQMSLLAHRDALSTLPPEAAARLVNANYTLSRDVQSQSSILMNWLWGKSTPKVVHM